MAQANRGAGLAALCHGVSGGFAIYALSGQTQSASFLTELALFGVASTHPMRFTSLIGR